MARLRFLNANDKDRQWLRAELAGTLQRLTAELFRDEDRKP